MDARKLEAMLVCPVCHGDVAMNETMNEDRDEHMDEHRNEQSSSMLCSGCGRRYPVVDGIPVMIATGAE